jgi:hypothetical protein
VVCCAVGRADVVGQFFDHLTADMAPSISKDIFLQLREAVTIVTPYLGMPTCIPACYGMIGVVQRKGSEYASTQVLRKETIDEDDVRKGKELRTRIYSGVGNSEIFDLMNVYFTDLCKSDLKQELVACDSNHSLLQLLVQLLSHGDTSYRRRMKLFFNRNSRI